MKIKGKFFPSYCDVFVGAQRNKSFMGKFAGDTQ